MKDLLIQLPNDELTALMAKYPDNTNIQTLAQGILDEREIAIATEKAIKTFTDKITKVFDKLDNPLELLNVHICWKLVEIGEPVAIELVKDGQKVTEMRCEQAYRWVLETNHVCKAYTMPASAASANARAITVFKRNGESVETVGNFRTASKACEYLKLAVGGNSGSRVLQTAGYFTEKYTGTEFIL